MMLRSLVLSCGLVCVAGCSSNTEVAKGNDAGTGNTSAGGTAGTGGSGGNSSGAGGTSGSSGASGSGGGTSGSGGTAGSGGASGSGGSGGSARDWAPTEKLETRTIGANQPDVATYNGNAMVVWGDLEGAKARFYDSTTQTWADIVAIDPRPGVRKVRVGVDVDGQFLAVWMHDPYDGDSVTGVFASRSLNGSSWSPAIPVHGADSCCDIALAVADDGTARAVWEQLADNPTDPSSTQTALWSAYFDGTNWGSAEVAAAGNPTEVQTSAREAKIVTAATGQGLIVWQQENETDDTPSIWWRAFSGATLQGQPAELESHTGNSWYFNVGMNASGQAIAVWVEDTSTDAGLMANRYNPTAGGWIGAAPISRAFAIRDPAVAVDDDGSAVLVYAESIAGFMQLRGVTFTTADGWQTATPLETDDQAVQGFVDQLLFPDLAQDGAGNVIVTWTSGTGPLVGDDMVPVTWGAHARRWTKTDRSWSETSLLGRFDNMRAWLPQVDASADGSAMAVWYYSDITDDGAGDAAESRIVNAAAYR